MATSEKKRVNRSELVREYLKSAKPSERSPKMVVEALKAKGITVSTQLVSQVKNALKKKSRKKAASVAAKVRHKNNSDMQSWTIARDLLRSVGGDITVARKNLEIVFKLMS
jgi:hypothetical protein